MKTIAQFLISVAISAGLTASFNTDVRGKIANAVQGIEAQAAQMTNVAIQTTSNAAVGTGIQS